MRCSAEGEPLDPALVLDVARQMLAALSYAHGLGVVHRDLKPDNVFLARDGSGRNRVKLLDYGLAKFLSPGDDPVKGALTMTGVMMGTPLYMPPEQAAGKTIDARVDVYALGCVLFEMLSGQPPFLGESHAEIFRAHMLAPVPTLEEAFRACVLLRDCKRSSIARWPSWPKNASRTARRCSMRSTSCRDRCCAQARLWRLRPPWVRHRTSGPARGHVHHKARPSARVRAL